MMVVVGTGNGCQKTRENGRRSFGPGMMTIEEMTNGKRRKKKKKERERRWKVGGGKKERGEVQLGRRR